MVVKSLVKKGNHVVVTFEEGERLFLNYEIAVKSALRKNDDISERKLNEIKTDNEKFEIKSKSFQFLGRREHSAFELRAKLIKKGFDKELINNILKELQEKDYLSDKRFAEKFFEERIKKKKGLTKIRSELMGKGVDRSLIDQIIDENASQDVLEKNALEICGKKYNSLIKKDLPDQKIKQKLYAYLINRGFSHEIIRSVIDKTMGNNYDSEFG